MSAAEKRRWVRLRQARPDQSSRVAHATTQIMKVHMPEHHHGPSRGASLAGALECPDMKVLIGIDEVGRGPLAGPISVGVVAAIQANYAKVCRALRELGSGDSKAMPAWKREKVAAGLRRMARRGEVRIAVRSVSASAIDRRGIASAARRAVAAALRAVDADPALADVSLDAGLSAPRAFTQRSIVRGETAHPLIGAASCLAKVSRDALMSRLAARHPGYGFEGHAGYGTLAHRRAILALGPSAIHRVSFLSKITAVRED